MSTMRIEISFDTFATCIAVLREKALTTPDKRAAAAMVDLKQGALREVDREIAAISEPPQVSAFLRKQAG